MLKKLKIASFTLVIILVVLTMQYCQTSSDKDWQWETIDAIGLPTARHEAALVAYNDKLLLIGGRRINSTDEFDTKTNTWLPKSPTPIELHHFQPVVVGDTIYLIGAMTGKWPNEKPLDSVLMYLPKIDKYEYIHAIPEHRRRGGAGAVYYKGKIYLIGGITNGHVDGYQPWLDEYNPKTGEWKVLPDAPDARDHFQAAVLEDKLYAFAGRRTSKRTEQDMALTASHGNVFNFGIKKWEAVTNNYKIPTERAGNAAFVWGDEVIIGGGESLAHEIAHNEVEAFNTASKSWNNWPKLIEGRHGSGFAIVGNYVYTASGSGNRGGGPELTTIERLKLPVSKRKKSVSDLDLKPVYKQWHTITISFKGPKTSENAADNPFLNYRLNVDFTNGKTKKTIRGFYAADGNASETSAISGNIWKVRFTPDELGDWTYSASLQHKDSIALKDESIKGTEIKITNKKGEFVVIESDKDKNDFRAHGRLIASNGYYKFKDSDKYWIKGGTNSPENLLGYIDFDDTYRMQTSAREGEASTTEQIHTYKPHLKDWKTGDPSWKNGKGKSLVGAINYLASKGINASYFLTMNILGDGKDVWPYSNPKDFTRFDVSKLDQWEIVFQHMQSKGILLHFVIQETENETMLDNGETGALRQLYFRELIARFGHHLALNWNLGEENGPASWSPIGQNDRQRKAMAKFLKETDPYSHPVLLHTHSHDPLRKSILDSIIGFEYLDGLSLQQDKRELAPNVVAKWRQNAKSTGHDWLITMDEIGMWHTAALPDSLDSNHDTLRRYALWGTLLSGGAGVEWYFGAKYPHNDLNSEDWRQRDRLWELTHYATSFFQENLDYWKMSPNHKLINDSSAYCLVEKGSKYAIYLPNPSTTTVNLREEKGVFNIKWFDPLNGGELKIGTKEEVTGGNIVNIGKPPTREHFKEKKDWVCIISKTHAESN